MCPNQCACLGRVANEPTCAQGGFFVVNLFLAVVFDEFMRSKEISDQVDAMQKRHVQVLEYERDMSEETPEKEGTLDGAYVPLKERRPSSEPGGESASKTVQAKGGLACLRRFVKSPGFANVSLSCLMLNVVIMCMPYAGQSAIYEEAIETMSFMFTLLFTIEVIVRLAGLGFADFWRDGWHRFDTVLVAVSFPDLVLTLMLTTHILTVSDNSGSASFLYLRILRILRMARVLRMMRMMRYWDGLNRIVHCLLSVGRPLINICVLLFVLLTIFALIAMELFGGLCGSEDGSRFHFDYYYPAMITTMAVFAGGWVDTYHACAAPGSGTELSARIYMLVALIVGFFVTLNLFIAILLDSFSAKDDDSEEEASSADGSESESGSDAEDADAGSPTSSTGTIVGKRQHCYEALRKFGLRNQGAQDIREFSLSIVTAKWWENVIFVSIIISTACLAVDSPRNEHPSTAQLCDALNLVFTILFSAELTLKILAYDFLQEPNGYLLSGWNWLDLCIVATSLLAYVPGLDSLKSLKLLRVLRPLRLLSRIQGMRILFEFFAVGMPDILNVAGVCIFFQTVFAVLALQIFRGTFGFCTDQTITTRELCKLPPPPTPPAIPQPPMMPIAPSAPPPAWTVYCEQWGSLDARCGKPNPPPLYPPSAPLPSPPPPSPPAMPPSPPPFPPSKCLDDPSYTFNGWTCASWRGLPCRSGFEQVLSPEQIHHLLQSCPISCADIEPGPCPLPGAPPPPVYPGLGVKLLVRLQEWSGDDNSGQQDDVELFPLKPQLSGQTGRHLKSGSSSGSSMATSLPPVWVNPPFGSFDDFWSASLLLFIAATGDAWEDIMFAGMDATEYGAAPVRNDFSPNALFFIAWLVLGTFTMMNLFVGVTVDNFTRIRKEMDGRATLTKEQNQWVQTMNESRRWDEKKLTVKLKAPDQPMRRAVFEIVTSSTFEFTIMGVIIANTFLMAVHFYHIEDYPRWNSFYNIGMLAFSLVYYTECISKLFGLGVLGYFRDTWNCFDFSLVCTSLIDQFAAQLLEFLPLPPMLLRVLRMLRLLRLLRLLKNFKGVRDLVMTLVLSFPSFTNIGGLMVLITFIYAVLGVQLFTYVMPGDFLRADKANFLSLPNAFLLLLQVTTLDNWSALMASELELSQFQCGRGRAVREPSHDRACIAHMRAVHA